MDSSLVLPECVWLEDHPLAHGQSTGNHILKEKGHQQPIAPPQGWGLVSPSPIHAGMLTASMFAGLVQVTTAAANSQVQQPRPIWETAFLSLP